MILNTLRFIANHPLNAANKVGAITRFIKWQVAARLNPHPIIYPFTENSQILVWKGLAGATGNLYCGLHEFYDMGFLLHFLRPEDTFVDAGANIGSYTILASAEIGTQSITIEPVPVTFKHLQNNILINDIKDKVTALNIGLGASAGSIKFTRGLDTVNHVAVAGETDTIDVPIDTLDAILANKNPNLIKIDVEGFETELLKGAVDMLKNPSLNAIIIELNGSGKRYGYDEQQIHQSLLDAGFAPYAYEPFARTLTSLATFGDDNTIYIRDLAFVQARVSNARKVRIGEHTV